MIQILLLLVMLVCPFGLADNVAKPLVYVQDSVITRYDLAQRIKVLKMEMPAAALERYTEDQLHQHVLEQMVGDLVQYNEALRLKVTVSDEEARAGIDRTLKSKSLMLSQFKRELTRNRIDYKDYFRQFKQDMTVSKLHQSMFYDRIKVSSEDIKTYIREHQFDRNSYLVTSVIIPSRLYTKDQVEGLQARWKQSESIAWPSDVDINQLDWRGYNDFPSQLQKSLVKLTIGQVSNPIKSSSNYILLRLNNINKQEDITDNEAQRQIYNSQFKVLFEPWYQSILKHTYIKHISNAS
ncbi:MAG TPA: SurA N-terminal domain-containing protein [Gammaproteobacteria bacterium]|nr:SurA N-terminal domain-containing protein [Gammaproteobacteria bacterium]